ncbi:fused DSP-PTPase phosphatase/NAD kinase-like protein [Singulisphaera sp. PoT]|uniref:fused DSP-PTPase phosphatase/NAD kinase-like protein n=1 Tax=Singulisphaera sp. PoT TaxID=3411797 RepID=UPI003BF47799
MRTAIIVTTLSIAAIAAWITIETRRNRLVWDHFDVVKPGVLYRSGQLNGDQLKDAISQYKIRTVVNFQYPGDGVNAEREITQKLGIGFVNLPMPGDGFGREHQFREVLKACDDPARRPVLIHCARGTCRTGAAVALYRFERDGWTIQDVAAEMRRQTYREGWLPGYIYGMVRNHPNQAIYDQAVVLDQQQQQRTQERAKETTNVR